MFQQIGYYSYCLTRFRNALSSLVLSSKIPSQDYLICFLVSSLDSYCKSLPSPKSDKQSTKPDSSMSQQDIAAAASLPDGHTVAVEQVHNWAEHMSVEDMFAGLRTAAVAACILAEELAFGTPRSSSHHVLVLLLQIHHSAMHARL